MQRNSDESRIQDDTYSPPELRRLGAIGKVTETSPVVVGGPIDGGAPGNDYPS